MMTMYVNQKSHITKTPCAALDNIDSNTIWLDMENMSTDEEALAESHLGIDIPSREEMHEIEVSNRLYQENGATFMTASLITKSDTEEPEIHAVTFIITPQKLITIRYSNPLPFINFSSQIERLPAPQTPIALFIGLITAVVERIADILERVGRNIDTTTRNIFRTPSRKKGKPKHQEDLEKIGSEGDLISKTRESMVSLIRMIVFAMQSNVPNMSEESLKRLDTLLKDVSALSDHASFLSNKVNFQLDATLGMINIEQNNIIKIFSVATAVFLPPTLIASIYGMNFRIIPELQWKYGYAFAVMLMLISALLPYAYFKKRKWL